MANYYCVNCGAKFSSISSLAANPCIRHPNGANKGKHILYEGAEKREYICKFCGKKFSSIASMTANPCIKHPNGANKGKHFPAL